MSLGSSVATTATLNRQRHQGEHDAAEADEGEADGEGECGESEPEECDPELEVASQLSSTNTASF